MTAVRPDANEAPDVGEPWTRLESTYADALPELVLAFQGDEVPDPEVAVLNESLAAELGIPTDVLRTEAGAGILSGSLGIPGVETVALAYAGHQFGNYSPRLGDGRALLLGESLDSAGQRFDLHLKGSGRTPFARGGDGKATIGPMLREYVIAEAMHALGIPTTRALSVCTTGESIYRDRLEPGAVLARSAASHIRVGTFEYAVRAGGDELVRRLADYSIARHHPDAAEQPDPYRAFLAAVVEAQAELIARWMLVGFIHGVMNTDNMTISGESIDYGPCAFMDRYDPDTVFSSIDHGGRYRFGNQPSVAVWNLSRLAETVLGLLSDDDEEAKEIATAELQKFSALFDAKWRAGMATKLGFESAAALSGPSSGTAGDDPDADGSLIDDLLVEMKETGLDWTSTFRSLADELRQADSQVLQVTTGVPLAEWQTRWIEALKAEALRGADVSLNDIADGMDAVNPLYIPRNHMVHEALEAANEGELSGFSALLERVTQPFTEVGGAERFAEPAPDEFASIFRTFCGT
ncbi:MAG: protein adenylyltransferase SelO [Microthrixaceae bacterium]